MNEEMEEKEYFRLVAILFCLLGMLEIFLLVILINPVSASPYQLNLSTGELIDMNISNNQTANITIYIINNTMNNYTTQNVTWLNITNVTNTTCVNCTNNYSNYTNISWYNSTYSVNGSNGTFYTRTEVDSKLAAYKTITEFNTFDTTINNKVNAINQSGVVVEEKSLTILWILSIAGCVLALISIVIIVRNFQ